MNLTELDADDEFDDLVETIREDINTIFGEDLEIERIEYDN